MNYSAKANLNKGTIRKAASNHFQEENLEQSENH